MIQPSWVELLGEWGDSSSPHDADGMLCLIKKMVAFINSSSWVDDHEHFPTVFFAQKSMEKPCDINLPRRIRMNKKTWHWVQHLHWQISSCFSVKFLSTRKKTTKLHPGRLTWNIIIGVWKIIFLSKWVICMFHVNLPGCSCLKCIHMPSMSWNILKRLLYPQQYSNSWN